MSLLFVDPFENVGGEDDGKVLVGNDGIECNSCGRGRSDKRYAFSRERDYSRGDMADHSARLHASSEEHRADDEVHRVEHSAHAFRRNKRVDIGIPGSDSDAVVDCSYKSDEKTFCPRVVPGEGESDFLHD